MYHRPWITRSDSFSLTISFTSAVQTIAADLSMLDIEKGTQKGFAKF